MFIPQMREQMKEASSSKEPTSNRKVVPKPAITVEIVWICYLNYEQHKPTISSSAETITEPIPEKTYQKEITKDEDMKEQTFSEEEYITMIREHRKKLSQIDNLIQKRSAGLQLEQSFVFCFIFQ